MQVRTLRHPSKALTRVSASRAGEDVSAWVGELGPAQVVFWSGAGVSLASPTNLLDGVTLTQFVMDWAFDGDPLSELCGPVAGQSETSKTSEAGLYERLNVGGVVTPTGTRYRFPRLEVVLGVASSPAAHGAIAIDAAIASMHDARPNRNHRFFYEHCLRGGCHITANFDRCVERAGIGDVSKQVLHFHGSTEDAPLTLGATFREIERGLPKATQQRLLAALTSARCLVFVGYSGLDVFDVAPWFSALAQSGTRPLSGLKVLWIDYQGSALVPAEEPPSIDCESGTLDAFLAEEGVAWDVQQRTDLRQAGADVTLLRGDPQALYEHLTHQWSIEISESSETLAVAAPRGPAPAANPEARTRATVALWHALGWDVGALDAIRRNPGLFAITELLEVEANVAWQRGQYRQARKLWADARPRSTAEQRATWDERQIACRWVAGQFVSATLRVRIALRRAAKQGVSSVELLELRGRIAQHMARTPDLRWLSSIERRQVARSIERAQSEQLGIHASVRLASVAAALASSVDGEANPAARSQFLESESLSSLLNYRHGRLRRMSDPNACRFRDQQRWFRVLGHDGDANRVVFLPGAAAAMGFGACWTAAWANQFGMMQRCRLLVYAAIRWVRSKRGHNAPDITAQ
jgi:hypothetical protein